MQFGANRGISAETALSGPGDPAVLRSGIHQYDIRSDFTDAVPGDAVILMGPQKPCEFAGPGDNDGGNLAFRHFNQDVGNITKPAAVADTDNLLALKLGEFHRHS